MKKLAVSALCVIIFGSVSGQDLVKRISLQICNCIDTIENMDSLQAKLDRCLPEAMVIAWDSDAEDDNQYYFNTEDSITNTVKAIMGKLIYYCPKIKKYILADKEAQYYKMSDSDLANEFYLSGNKAFESDDFKTAEKQYLKAIKVDPEYIYAFDNLALTYRNLGKYKKAVKYYDKSLKIYPEGSFAIQNQAVAFTYLKDNARALENYKLLINLYPDNPEGYYGTAKIYILYEDYENALDYILYCHKLYVSQNSDYVKDSESLVSEIYNKMKEQNKLDIFNQKAKEYGIKIN